MIRVGLIGFGLAGRVFHAPLISSVDGLELASVLERSSDEAAKRYPGIRIHRVLDDMLADATLDLIVVATPSGTHFEIARQVIAAGKHVIVDKPVAPHSAQIAELARLAGERSVLLIPFHNRRWDGDVRTVQKLVAEGALGRLVHVDSRMERWAPGAARKPWKNEPEQGGGVLLDLGTHLVDLTLCLFGLPLGVAAEVERERGGEGANDSIEIRLRYAAMRATLISNLLTSPAGPRFVLRGTRGNFRKSGLDPQEAALGKITRIETADWGKEPQSSWGNLNVDIDGAIVSRPVETIAGDYRQFYVGVRNAIADGAQPPVHTRDAWRTARLLEWAEQSAHERREILCNWTEIPF